MHTAFLLLVLAAPPEPRTVPLSEVEPDVLAARITADGRVLREAIRGAHRLVDWVLARRDVFPLYGPSSTPAAARRAWRSLLDHLLALDGAADWYGGCADLAAGRQSLQDDARLVALATFLARQALAVAAVDALAGNTALERQLTTELGADEPGLLPRLEARARAPGIRHVVEARYAAYRALRGRLLARRGAVSVGWMLPYVEKQVRALRDRHVPARTTLPVEPSAERWFSGRTRAAAWFAGQPVGRREDTSLSAATRAALERELRPGDVILLRRERYRATLSWPGRWHTALVYLGVPSRLDAVFGKQPEVSAFFRRRGSPDGRITIYLARRFAETWRRATPGGPSAEDALAVEAGWEGVRLARLDHLLAGDAAVVLRTRLGPLVLARALARTFHYVGRRYDRHHDGSEDGALDAGELVRFVFLPGDGHEDGLELPLAPYLERSGVPVDAFARQAVADASPWEVVAFADAAGLVVGPPALRRLAGTPTTDPP